MGNKADLYDILLVIALLGSGWKALFGRDSFTSTIFFIVYGLLMAMAWVQLGAADVALAEACIGAGLTGALLVNAIRQFEADADVDMPQRGVFPRALLAVLSLVLFAGLSSAIARLNEAIAPIPSLVNENLAISGSSHPVTAVLINFRAFDTWLELGVLLLASVAAVAIHHIYDAHPAPAPLPPSQGQPQTVARLMFPLLLLVGGVLLWFGSHAPGGAFQAGALIGAAGILLQVSGEISLSEMSTLRIRFFLALGFSTFLMTALLTFAAGRHLLEFPPQAASALILMLEMAAMLSIALTLNVMYAGSQPGRMRQ